MPGPIGKPLDQRRHHGKPSGPDVVKAEAGTEIEWTPAPRTWHPIAIDWYESLQVSGQAQFYEQTDVTQAVLTAELMSRELFKDEPSASMMQSVFASMATLLTSEGARRRSRVVLERPVAPEKKIALVDQLTSYQRAAGQ